MNTGQPFCRPEVNISVSYCYKLQTVNYLHAADTHSATASPHPSPRQSPADNFPQRPNRLSPPRVHISPSLPASTKSSIKHPPENKSPLPASPSLPPPSPAPLHVQSANITRVPARVPRRRALIQCASAEKSRRANPAPARRGDYSRTVPVAVSKTPRRKRQPASGRPHWPLACAQAAGTTHPDRHAPWRGGPLPRPPDAAGDLSPRKLPRPEWRGSGARNVPRSTLPCRLRKAHYARRRRRRKQRGRAVFFSAPLFRRVGHRAPNTQHPQAASPPHARRPPTDRPNELPTSPRARRPSARRTLRAPGVRPPCPPPPS